MSIPDEDIDIGEQVHIAREEQSAHRESFSSSPVAQRHKSIVGTHRQSTKKASDFIINVDMEAKRKGSTGSNSSGEDPPVIQIQHQKSQKYKGISVTSPKGRTDSGNSMRMTMADMLSQVILE